MKTSLEISAGLKSLYQTLWRTDPIVVHAPGRVNLIGEHTDYNDGFVMPAAIDRGISVALGKRSDHEIHLYSVQYEQYFTATKESLKPSSTLWANYILGVAAALVNSGYNFHGFNMAVDGNVPVGAGLSSSAAVECAAIYGLSVLFELDIDRMSLAKMAQGAEHEFAGVMCGIMDQFASMFGRKGNVLKLDCRSLDYEYLPLDLSGYKIVLFNSNVNHSLASSEYNIRRQQCEQGVTWVKAENSQVRSLRDVDVAMLNACVKTKDPLIYRRCKYVIEENERVQSSSVYLRNGDIASFGQKMYESHDGLSKDYGVSCKELDFLVNYVKGRQGVVGARMMGGGFGGCTINIVHNDRVEELIETISQEYREKMGLNLETYIAVTADGASVQ